MCHIYAIIIIITITISHYYILNNSKTLQNAYKLEYFTLLILTTFQHIIQYYCRVNTGFHKNNISNKDSKIYCMINVMFMMKCHKNAM